MQSFAPVPLFLRVALAPWAHGLRKNAPRSRFAGSIFGSRWAGHAAVVDSVAYSPDGARALSGSTDGTHRVWDTSTGLFRRWGRGGVPRVLRNRAYIGTADNRRRTPPPQDQSDRRGKDRNFLKKKKKFTTGKIQSLILLFQCWRGSRLKFTGFTKHAGLTPTIGFTGQYSFFCHYLVGGLSVFGWILYRRSLF